MVWPRTTTSAYSHNLFIACRSCICVHFWRSSPRVVCLCALLLRPPPVIAACLRFHGCGNEDVCGGGWRQEGDKNVPNQFQIRFHFLVVVGGYLWCNCLPLPYPPAAIAPLPKAIDFCFSCYFQFGHNVCWCFCFFVTSSSSTNQSLLLHITEWIVRLASVCKVGVLTLRFMVLHFMEMILATIDRGIS